MINNSSIYMWFFIFELYYQFKLKFVSLISDAAICRCDVYIKVVFKVFVSCSNH